MSTPVWKRSPRGPKGSPIGPATGGANEGPSVGGGSRRAATVAGPATASTARRAQRWKRRSARSVCDPNEPSKVPDGKPCSASANCSSSTSDPDVPAASGREPSGRRRNACRVRGPTTPSARGARAPAPVGAPRRFRLRGARRSGPRRGRAAGAPPAAQRRTRRRPPQELQRPARPRATRRLRQRARASIRRRHRRSWRNGLEWPGCVQRSPRRPQSSPVAGSTGWWRAAPSRSTPGSGAGCSGSAPSRSTSRRRGRSSSTWSLRRTSGGRRGRWRASSRSGSAAPTWPGGALHGGQVRDDDDARDGAVRTAGADRLPGRGRPGPARRRVVPARRDGGGDAPDVGGRNRHRLLRPRGRHGR